MISTSFFVKRREKQILFSKVSFMEFDLFKSEIEIFSTKRRNNDLNFCQ